MAFAMGVLIFIVGMLGSIALHEVGHMVPAKRFGVRVSQYMVGFGPTLWSRTVGETEYGIKGIPLGGYVRLVGMYPTTEAVEARSPTTWASRMAADAREASAEEIRPGEDARAFYRLSVPKKIIIMLGGPTMNLLIAAVLLAVAMVGIGYPTVTTTVGEVSTCVLDMGEDTCAQGAAPAPARAAGIQPGDTIITWNGHEAASWSALTDAIRGSSGTVPVVVERDGQELTLDVGVAQVDRPVYDEAGVVVTDTAGDPVLAPVGFAGITPVQELQRQPLYAVPSALGQLTWQTAQVVLNLPQRVWDTAAETINGEPRGADSVLSIVGVGRVFGEASVLGEGVGDKLVVLTWLNVLAALNVSLFVFNMIPLPPLDGGHVAAALWEGARRQATRLRGERAVRPADSARLVPLAYAMFVVLGVMGAILIVADLVNPVSLT
jgi:membrane-associated protease RseP (regulator of RpoE activity)